MALVGVVVGAFLVEVDEEALQTVVTWAAIVLSHATAKPTVFMFSISPLEARTVTTVLPKSVAGVEVGDAAEINGNGSSAVTAKTALGGASLTGTAVPGAGAFLVFPFEMMGVSTLQ